MPLEAVVESLETVPEAVREHYKQVEGVGFVLDTNVKAHPEATAVKKALDAERTRATKAEADLKAYRDAGFSPEQIAELKAKSEKDKPDLEKLIEKRLKEVEGRYAKDLEERDALRAETRKLKLDDRVRSAALKAGMLPEDVDDEMDVLLHGRIKRFDLDEKGKVIVLDEDGDPTGKTPEQWFAEVYKTKKPKVFAGTGASGSGARGGGGSGDVGVVTLTPEQASDVRTYQAALEKVGGDHSKVKIAQAA